MNNKDLKFKGYFSLKEIESIFFKSRHTVRYWINKGWLKAEKGKNKFRPWEYFIKEKDWYDMPAFMRRRFKKVKN